MFVVSVKHFVDMLICVSLAVGRILTNIFFDSFLVMVMVVNATLNNISAISWRSVLLVEETESGENH